jgi:hypothetical protein
VSRATGRPLRAITTSIAAKDLSRLGECSQAAAQQRERIEP